MSLLNLPAPMLASPMPKGGIKNPADWVAEEKYDGHRLIVRVTHDGEIKNPSGYSAISRDGNPRTLPARIVEALFRLPSGVYDGELTVPGSRSYGVTEKLNESKLVLILFDVIEWQGHNITQSVCGCSLHFGMTSFNYDYAERRSLLAQCMEGVSNEWLKPAEVWGFSDSASLTLLTNSVWDRGGEGLILKRKSSPYAPGKRSKDWVKIKACASAVLTVYGYEAGKNGPYAKLRLRDDDGNETTVKTLNNAELERYRLNPIFYIGRRARIEFQERTPDGSYRHPRFDRWEDE